MACQNLVQCDSETRTTKECSRFAVYSSTYQYSLSISSFTVREILIETSKVLESLSEVLGVQSFVLAVDPQDPEDAGFLGGSLVGREFYRGLRGGGTAGASSFKTFAQKRFPSAQAQEEAIVQEALTQSSPVPPATRSARQIKVDLYETTRSQLRCVYDFFKNLTQCLKSDDD